MELQACLLKFTSGVHLGDREGWLEGTGVMVHADTLFGAFCHGYRLLYGVEELERLLRQFLQDEAPFLLSSAFPHWRGTLYLPTPLCQMPQTKQEKKINYVGLQDWQRLLAGETLNGLGVTAELLPGPDGTDVPWEIMDVPRVGLNRRTAHPDESFFHVGEVRYNPEAGLYFLFRIYKREEENRFLAVWRFLAHEGLGGDRSSGKGHFAPPEWLEVDLAGPAAADHVVCLSPYYPRREEIFGLQEGYYELIERRGYVYSPASQSLRRRPLRMFAEGAVFPIPPSRRGSLVDVTPEVLKAHQVYRYGFALTVPCRLPGGAV